MVPVATATSSFEARVIAARLGADGIVWQFRGSLDGPLGPLPGGQVTVLVVEDDYEAALTAKADTEALALDPATFEDDANALTESFQAEVDKVGDSFAQLDEDYPSPELSSAISDSCDFL